MPQTLHVHSRVKDYDILFTDHVLKTLADCLGERKQRKLLFITDQTVYHLYQTLFEEFAQQYNAFVHVCPPGGQTKSLERVSAIYDQLIAENFSKKI